MFSGPFATYASCPRCGHRFEREPGFFQGAMYVSYALGVGLFAVLVLISALLFSRRVGFVRAVLAAVLAYLFCVPVLFRYSRVIWAHGNIGTLQADEEADPGVPES
jgi:hypothetical protein